MTALLAVRGLSCRFETRDGPLWAVRDVDLDIAPGETLGLVGESGCGKSTLARSIVGLLRPAAGSVRLAGAELLGPGGMSLAQRRQIQFVFQDPFASLNPRRTAATLIGEPLDVHRIGSREERRARVRELMRRVGLREEWGRRYPHEFSGGQRQRIGIARALALSPRLIICDEPVSALDVSIQAQVVNLLAELQRELGIAYLFISHDLALVELFAHRVAVMYRGRIVEQGDSRAVWRDPAHPFTRTLIEAIPLPDPSAPHRRFAALGPPGRVARSNGEACAYLEACRWASDACGGVPAPWRALEGDHAALCHGAPV
jgi:oligopeptide/dipeptide ABC transporter ATP-binding protein